MAGAASPTQGGGGSAPAADSAIADIPRFPVANHTLLVIGTMLAALMQVLDSTIANVALPHMQSALGAQADTVTWVLTSYIIASAVALPTTGWLAGRIGSRRLFLLSVSGFVIASMLCGMARNLETMVLFRCLQGISGAYILPLSQSSMLDATKPSRHAPIMALWSLGVIIGPIIGPVLGGYLTEYSNWRWIFYVNVPLGIIALSLLLAQLPETPRAERPFDWTGFLLVAVALAALQMLLDRGHQVDWFHATESWIYLGIIVSCVWMAVVHFCTHAHPLFDRQLFGDLNYNIALVFMVVTGIVMYANMALLPPLMQSLLGYSVIDTGILLVPRSVGTLISMQAVGWLVRRGVDGRILVGTGTVLLAYSLHMMAGWSLAVDQHHIIVSGVIMGVGVGMIFLPVNVAAFTTLKPQLRAEGSSLLNLFRSVGSSIGISIMTALYARNIQISHADLSAHISGNLAGVLNSAAVKSLHPVSDAAAYFVDAEINRQAAMIAYIDDFYLMMWFSLATLPLILLMKIRPGPTFTPQDTGH
jgi:DHA2 family multidrug resistance protein